MRRVPYRRALLLGLILAALSPRARADTVPAERRALLLLKALAYDRNLPQRSPGTLTVVVAFDGRRSEARRDAEAMGESLMRLARPRDGADASLRVVRLDLRDAPAAALSGPLAALYLCEGTPRELVPTALAITRPRRILSVGTAREEAVAGVTLAIVRRGDRAGLVVNRAAAAQEGVDFDATLLKLAEVLDGAK